uniref:Uncharacterized protein n=1 Tax=Anguilla anguilla TaxID=7936 RepID=A0A0E9S0B6_ANGAN
MSQCLSQESMPVAALQYYTVSTFFPNSVSRLVTS